MRAGRIGTSKAQPLPVRLTTALALLVLLGVVGMWCWTWSPASRLAPPLQERAMAGPELACWSGYNALGRCTLLNLAGGVHSFLGPGLLAMLVTVVGGMGLGLLAAYDRSPVKSLARALLSGLDGLPRLAVFMLVFTLSDHSPLALGLSVGLLGMPGLAVELRERFERLQRSSFIQASRAHGLREGRIVGLHLLWLACQERILRQGVLAFGAMLVVESALSFALQVNASPTEESWGHLLYKSTSGLYDVLSLVMDEPLAEVSRRVLNGLLPFGWVAGLLLLVLWATWQLGDTLAQGREVER